MNENPKVVVLISHFLVLHSILWTSEAYTKFTSSWLRATAVVRAQRISRATEGKRMRVMLGSNLRFVLEVLVGF